MNLKIKKIVPQAELVPFEHPTDAGMDFKLVEDVTLPPHVSTKVRTGLSMEIPEGCVGFVWDKSSIGAMGIKTLGGVIDAGYRGEVFIVLLNMTNEPVTFVAGRKIAQLVVQKIELPEIGYVDELSASPRGQGGFGSTGK